MSSIKSPDKSDLNPINIPNNPIFPISYAHMVTVSAVSCHDEVMLPLKPIKKLSVLVSYAKTHILHP